jgi:hypothetical protein
VRRGSDFLGTRCGNTYMLKDVGPAWEISALSLFRHAAKALLKSGFIRIVDIEEESENLPSPVTFDAAGAACGWETSRFPNRPHWRTGTQDAWTMAAAARRARAEVVNCMFAFLYLRLERFGREVVGLERIGVLLLLLCECDYDDLMMMMMMKRNILNGFLCLYILLAHARNVK